MTRLGSRWPENSFLLAALLLVSLAHPAGAGEVFERDGVAISGYDPVAYFTEHRPVPGSREFTAEYQGSRFHFVSPANRGAFLADPEKFAPQYGGYCALGTAKGYKAATDPDAFTIVNDRLYLNYSLRVRALWQQDVPGYIDKADHNWPEVRKSSRVVQ